MLLFTKILELILRVYLSRETYLFQFHNQTDRVLFHDLISHMATKTLPALCSLLNEIKLDSETA